MKIVQGNAIENGQTYSIYQIKNGERKRIHARLTKEYAEQLVSESNKYLIHPSQKVDMMIEHEYLDKFTFKITVTDLLKSELETETRTVEVYGRTVQDAYRELMDDFVITRLDSIKVELVEIERP